MNEAELKAKGLSYHVDPKWNLIYVEKTNLQKTKDYAIRILGTPVTVVVDAAMTIAVVGAAVCLTSHDTRSSAELDAERIETQRKETEAQRKEMELINSALDEIRLQGH